ncbi:hypothetical protein C8F04DRAFT_1228489 [Mycena alexandri]|uniref:Uncharacterized protein n=1 Tax=Mycena alexandri TaxID=1745969 RepID=A0AAD6XA20_9AGAR|nr:hypothetical protein C8F04DRAFT_1228489 [Mycena alexandri]
MKELRADCGLVLNLATNLVLCEFTVSSNTPKPAGDWNPRAFLVPWPLARPALKGLQVDKAFLRPDPMAALRGLLARSHYDNEHFWMYCEAFPSVVRSRGRQHDDGYKEGLEDIEEVQGPEWTEETESNSDDLLRLREEALAESGV